jgi:hypothetical protein
MHLSEGTIQAYQDQELEAVERQQVQAHLKACPRCQQRATEMLARRQRLQAQFSSLEPASLHETPVHRARIQLDARLAEERKEKIPMWNKIITRVPRPAWAAMAVIAVLAVALAFEPVRAVANSFLGLFRVEQIRVVQVDPGQLEQQFGSSSQLEQMLTDHMQVNSRGEAREVASAEEASNLTGVPVRLPAGAEGEQNITVQPGGDVTFNIDLELVRAVLKDIGKPDIALPGNLDGASVEVTIPDGVIATYGDCKSKEVDSLQSPPDPDVPSDIVDESNCTTLVQVPSPTISAPPGLDIAQIGEAYLQLLGMTPEEAASFSRNVDWTTTFVIPIPRYGVDYQDVQVDGVTGTLLLRHGWNRFMLIWAKNGILYALSGPGKAGAALDLANSLK